MGLPRPNDSTTPLMLTPQTYEQIARLLEQANPTPPSQTSELPEGCVLAVLSGNTAVAPGDPVGILLNGGHVSSDTTVRVLHNFAQAVPISTLAGTSGEAYAGGGWGIAVTPAKQENDVFLVRTRGTAATKFKLPESWNATSVGYLDIPTADLISSFTPTSLAPVPAGPAKILWVGSDEGGFRPAIVHLGNHGYIWRGKVKSVDEVSETAILNFATSESTYSTIEEFEVGFVGSPPAVNDEVYVAWITRLKRYEILSATGAGGESIPIKCQANWVAGNPPVKYHDAGDPAVRHLHLPATGFDRTVQQKLVHPVLPSTPAECDAILQWAADTGGGGGGGDFCEMMVELAEAQIPAINVDFTYIPTIYWAGSAWACKFEKVKPLCDC